MTQIKQWVRECLAQLSGIVPIIFLIIAVPIVEIGVFIKVGGMIGLWPTIAVIFVTAVIGAGLLRAQGLAVIYQAQVAMAQGKMFLAQVFDGLLLLFAGAMLLTPGFVTDGVGFLLFIPPLRNVLRRSIAALIIRYSNIHIRSAGGFGDGSESGPNPVNISVIDGDFEDVTDDQDAGNKDGGGVEGRIE